MTLFEIDGVSARTLISSTASISSGFAGVRLNLTALKKWCEEVKPVRVCYRRARRTRYVRTRSRDSQGAQSRRASDRYGWRSSRGVGARVLPRPAESVCPTCSLQCARPRKYAVRGVSFYGSI
jgi:hypothetical protein